MTPRFFAEVTLRTDPPANVPNVLAVAVGHVVTVERHALGGSVLMLSGGGLLTVREDYDAVLSLLRAPLSKGDG